MVRIIIKGGVWKNTEDEILKAAISKYGKNQWARISSLLVRKTPKQCKARWYEWLDPSIKKTEWSKEEDEKLLHMAKLMPTQWRTIAPIVGRTATQCLERYQKLLDDAEAKEGEEAEGSGLGLTGPGGPEAAPSADDVRRLRPGEIDPNPETKPARPDAIDMDEDEKEMLSEARARLANTQGKKAKRKARERALEEARRLALLQKRRELKAAGILMRPKKPKKGMDYNADIPFEKQPVAGFYDVSEEQSRAFRAPVGQTLKAMDSQGLTNKEQAEKKRKAREAAAKKQGDKSAALAGQREEQLRKLREAEQISKRRKLNLPEAQVGERELEEIVKLGQAGETARGLVQDGNEVSEGLLGDYSALERAKNARTPRTAPEEDIVMREARNLRNQTMAQTPLLGDANAELHEGTGAAGAAPRSGVVQTPNPLLTPAHGGSRMDPGATPMSVRGGIAGAPSATPRTEVGDGRTPLRTPLRDNLGLNVEDGMSVVGQTPRDLKRAQRSLKEDLRASLRSLPAPKNDFELVLDEEPAQDDDVAAAKPLSVEDAADRDARLAKIKEEERRKALARRSQAVQLGLPRPLEIDAPSMLALLDALPALGEGDVAGRAQQLIDREMVRLIEHDAIVHPLPGSKHAGGGRTNLPEIDDDALDAARALVHAELASTLGFPGAKPDVLKRVTASSLDPETDDGRARLEALEARLAEQRNSLVWHAQMSAWVDRSDADDVDILRGYAKRLEAARSMMQNQATVAAKEEKRLGKLLGGYQARSAALSASIKEANTGLQEAAFAHAAFQRLADGEQGAILERLDKIRKEVDRLERSEKEGQKRYAEVDSRRTELRERMEELEQEIAMREAEAINEEALRKQEEAEGGADDAQMAEA